VMANRVGSEGALTFWGGSRVLGPFGEELARAGSGEQLLEATLDFERVRKARYLLPTVRDSNVALVLRETQRLSGVLGVPDFVRDA
jgi:N-carbamoylputrescine amidase